VKVASAVSAGYSSVEAREAELRTEINTALGKMRAYARDMEVRHMPHDQVLVRLGILQSLKSHGSTMKAAA
jgi:hypothetical protein